MRFLAAVSSWVLCGLVILAPDLALADCPQAREMRTRGAFSGAEKEARACLENEPANATVWAELSRALAGQAEYGEALQWADRAIEKHPDDPWLLVWKSRLLYWQDEIESATQLLQPLPEEVRQEPEVQLLRADLALADGRHLEAIRLYQGVVDGRKNGSNARYRLGVAMGQAGWFEQAEGQLSVACREGGDETRACDALEELRAEAPPNYWAMVRPGYRLVEDRLDGYSIAAAVGANPIRDLWVIAELEYQARSLGADERFDDFIGKLSGTYGFTRHFALQIGGSGTPDPEFSPEWTAWIEPSYTFDVGLQLRVRYWRIQFEPAGVSVINPTVVFPIGPVSIDARYYLGIEDEAFGAEDDRLQHSVLGRASYYFDDVTRVYAGGGFGDRADYLELDVPGSESHWLLVGGARLKVGEANTMMFDYIYRNEELVDLDYRHHEFLVGYRRDFR